MNRALLVAIAACAALSAVRAENLGVQGPTYRPDADAREQFKQAIRQKQQTGELDAYWHAYRDKTIDAVKNPAPLGVRTDYAQRTEVRAVRFTVPSNYRDHEGKLVVARGTVVEPLKIQPLASSLVFIDGRDPTQVDFAIARGRLEPIKIVLTAGSPYALRVKYQNAPWRGGRGIPFYFDQRRMIIDSLKRLYAIDITSVPVVLSQSGTGLRLEFGMGGRS